MSEILGRYTCPMGGRGTISQANRKGRHFTTRCSCCGFQQGTGAERQQFLWDNGEWLAEVPPMPVNVTETKTGEAEKEPESLGDFDPESEMQETEPETKTRSKNIGGKVALGLGVVGVIAAIVSA